MQTIDEIKQEVMSCTKCPRLVLSRNKICFSYGSGINSLMMIAEAPSQVGGNLTGRPLADNKSRTGLLVAEMLAENNLANEECYSTNICFCSPPMNDRPTPEEIANCLPYTKAEIEIIKPKLIVLFGTTARDCFIYHGWARDKVQQRQGQKYIYMYHPAYILKLNNKEITYQYKLAFKKAIEETLCQTSATSEVSLPQQLKMI